MVREEDGEIKLEDDYNRDYNKGNEVKTERYDPFEDASYNGVKQEAD